MWKDTLLQESRKTLKKVQVNVKDRVFHSWQQLHPDNKEHVVPFFTFKTSVRKMKDNSTEVLNIINAKGDSELLKMLLSKAGE